MCYRLATDLPLTAPDAITNAQSCQLDHLLVCRFRSFVVWRDTLSHVLLTTLAQSVRDSWSPPPQQLGVNAPTAQQLMAK